MSTQVMPVASVAMQASDPNIQLQCEIRKLSMKIERDLVDLAHTAMIYEVNPVRPWYERITLN